MGNCLETPMATVVVVLSICFPKVDLTCANTSTIGA